MSFSDSPTFDGGGCGLSVLGSALATAIVTGALAAGVEVDAAVIVFIVAFFISLPVIALSAILIGLPLTKVLESNGWERPWSYPLAGFVFGAFVYFLLLEAVGLPLDRPDGAFALLVGALPGALCGALWWWFERRHHQGASGRDS